MQAWRTGLLATLTLLAVAPGAAHASKLGVLRAAVGSHTAAVGGHRRLQARALALTVATQKPAPEVLHEKARPEAAAPAPPAPKPAEEPEVVYHAKVPASKVAAATAEPPRPSGAVASALPAGALPAALGLAVCAALVGFVVWYLWTFRRLRTARPLIAETPVRPIPQVRENQWAKIVGKVEVVEAQVRPSVLLSPLQSLACVYFATTAEALGQDGQNHGVVAQRQESCDFYIRDASGERILVSSADLCAYHLRSVVHQAYASKAELTAECQEFLRGRRPAAAAERSYIFSEALIEVGAMVMAFGMVARQPATGEPVLVSETATHQAMSGRKKGADPIEEGMKTLEQDEMHKLAAYVLVSDDPALM